MAARGVYKEHIFDGGRANLDSYLGDDMKHSVPLQTATSLRCLCPQRHIDTLSSLEGNCE